MKGEAQMRRMITLVLGGLLLVGLLVATWVNRGQASALECTLTGQKIASCCCQIRQGKLYCPLADQVISKCCCKVAGA